MLFEIIFRILARKTVIFPGLKTYKYAIIFKNY